MIAATGDPLFSFGYTRRVFDQIVAPAKELLVFEVDRHLLFNECVQLVTDPLVDRIRGLVAVPGTAEMARGRQGLWPSPLPSRSSPARHAPCIARRHVPADP